MPILTPQERLGTRVAGRYRIDRVLAIGGMSVVFEARDLRAHRGVVLKLLKPEDAGHERREARFLQETRLTAQLRHPHVVDVLDLGRDETDLPFLVLELLCGRSLQAELDARGTLELPEALAIVLPVMDALQAVHAAGVVHRDLKPDNIFLHTDARGAMTPKLLDFGIAKCADASLATRTGAVLGTPDYMAPEQLLAGVVGPSADIWGIGAVLYRVLHGQTPFHAATAAEVIAKLTREPAPPLRVTGLPASICVAIDRALAREVSDRYADMEEFAAALRLCAREAGFAVPPALAAPIAAGSAQSSLQRTLTAPSGAREPRWRKPRVAAALAAVALALIAAYSADRSSMGTAEASIATKAAGVAEQRVPPPPVEIPKAGNVPAPSAQSPAAITGAEVATVPAAPAAAAPVPKRKPRTSSRSRKPTASENAASLPVAPAGPRPSFRELPTTGDLPLAVQW